jgi:hypothetical protein
MVIRARGKGPVFAGSLFKMATADLTRHGPVGHWTCMHVPHSSEEWFLHRMDTAAGLGSYVSTSAGKLRDASFIDGREPFWNAQEVRPLTLDASRSSAPQSPPCFIFHVSFCGSTLLGQLLDQPGHTLVLREPQALVDLSAQQSGLTARGPEALAQLCDLAIREMGSLRTEGEALVIKPSNWANSLIPILCDAETGANAVFLSMDHADFVAAVFRGGHDRLAYTARAAAHLTATTGLGASAMQDAAERSDDPLDQMACFAALSHRVQEHIFKAAMGRRDWGGDHWFDFAHIVTDPVAAAKSAATVLGLDNDLESVERQASLFTKAHSKDKAVTFSSEQRVRENEAVKRHHGGRIKRAVEWATTAKL